MNRKLIGLFICTLMIASVFGSIFGSATNLSNESDQTNTNIDSNEKEAASLGGISLFSGGNTLNGGWHDEEELNKHANLYYQKTNDWKPWSTHGMHCDNYWDTSDNDYLYFEFHVDDLPVKEQSLKIGVEYKSDGVPWNGGPDLEVKNQDTNAWYKRKTSMGNPGSLTWKWYAMTDSDKYITSSGDVQFRILCAAGCHAWVDDVGIKYMSADEEIHEAIASTRDDNSDGSPDGVDIYIDVNVGDYGDGTTVDVIADGVLIDPDGNTIDSDSETWTIVDWETEYGILTLSALGGDNGEYTMEVTIYDDNNLIEGFANGTVELIPDPQATVTFNCDPGNGGAIIFEGSSYNNGQSTEISYGTYSIAANPATNFIFDYWSDDQGCLISDPNSQSTTVTVSGDGEITAFFENNLFEIDFYTNPTDGGTIIFDGDTWSNGQSGNYLTGTYVIDANPANQHYFDKWSRTGGISVDDEYSQSTTVTVTGDGSLTAEFVYDPVKYKVTFYTDPTDVGQIQFQQDTHSNGNSATYQSGTYGIQALFDEGKYKFTGWTTTGGVSVKDENKVSTYATVTAEGTLKASFEPKSNLEADGNLYWLDIQIGSNAEGSITIYNKGGPNSYLSWEITSYPNWGSWEFSEMSGSGIPEDGQTSISVTVSTEGLEKGESYCGYVKIVNTDNSNDKVSLSVTLNTEEKSRSINCYFLKLIGQFPILQQILKHLTL